MAILHKIRQRSLFLILIIGLALFSFVLSDLVGKGTPLFGGPQDIVITVNGKDIHREEFMSRVEAMQRQMGPNASATQAMNNVYDQMLRQAVMEAQYEELGLMVEQDEMRDLLKNSFSSFPEFNNEAGIFDEAKLNEFIANLKAISPERSPIGSGAISYAEWVDNERSIATGAMQQTYFNMIKAGIDATLLEGEADYEMENRLVDIKYALVPYTSIPDSLVDVSKSDVTKYINEHKKKYEVEASRDIHFVQFNEEASLEDEEEMKASLISLLDDSVVYNSETKTNDTIPGFKSTMDHEDFVNGNSDLKYNDNFIFKSNIPAAVADSIFNLEVNQIYGPYKDGENFKLSKIVAETQLPDSVKVRHILIPFFGAASADATVTRSDAQAKQLADSLLGVIKGNRSKFAELVTEFSSDQGSVNNGGEYDFHPYNTMVKPFNDFEFERNKGEIDVVKTVFGYHIVEILDQKNKARSIKVATIARKIEPSEATINELFNRTQKFEIAIQDRDFQEVADESKYEVKPVNSIKELQESIPGLGSQRSIVRWAFDAETKVGDYRRFSIPTGGYAVVQLVEINEKGLMDVQNASVTAIPEIRKEKKIKLIKEKIKATTVDEVAANQNVTVSTAVAINMNTTTLSGAGQEPKVVGTAFGLKEGETSKLIEGVKGIFLIEVTKITEAPKLDNYQANITRLSSQRVGQAQTKVYNALKNIAEIEDNRALFY